MRELVDDRAWLAAFEAERESRRASADPDWSQGAQLTPALIASIQRFQVGEDGDGRNLIDKASATGDAVYAAAVRLFVAEEQNHARLLARLLTAAGATTLAGHWSDTVFVRLRRLLGLRLELMVLMIAEVIALRYYRALRDGSSDPLAREVAARILADEERHVPFHIHRLRQEPPAQLLTVGAWWILMLGTVTVVALDHGRALKAVDLARWRFLRDVLTQFRAVVTASTR
ncbi:ferritin-like domain-containing protein [Nonomuraea sp. NPDC050556]|uniref:ferritin-like domain-containing protein n=1 Tax=Nonomuraea sp. NPDC050556 TaxID=3364369 RepID=UPI0037A9F942